MNDWVKAVTATGAVDGAVLIDGVMRVSPKALKVALKGMGFKTDTTTLGQLYAAGNVWSGVRRIDGKPTRVIEIPVTNAPVTKEVASAAVEAPVTPPAEPLVTNAPVTPEAQPPVMNAPAVKEAAAGVTAAPLSSPAADEKTDASEVLPVVIDEVVSDAVVLSPADQALVEQHGLEQVMGPQKKLIWAAPMNASRTARMAAIQLNNPTLFAEESSTPTGGTAAAATQESELEDAGSKTARVLLPNKEIVELKDGLAPVSVLENLPPGTELEGDKPCRIKGREGVWHLHATRAREDASGIDALVLSPDRSGVLVADLFSEVELIEQPDDGFQIRVIGNDGQVVDPVTGEIEGPHAPEQVTEQVTEQAAVSQEDQKGVAQADTPGKTQAGRDLRHLAKVVEKPAPAPASPVALKEIDPAVLQKLPGDAKREGDVLCVVPGHPEQWKLHATRCRPDGGVNALLVATQGTRVVVVDRAVVELLPPPAAPPAKKARKKAAATPEDQLDRVAAKLARKFKGQVVEEAVAA